MDRHPQYNPVVKILRKLADNGIMVDMIHDGEEQYDYTVLTQYPSFRDFADVITSVDLSEVKVSHSQYGVTYLTFTLEYDSAPDEIVSDWSANDELDELLTKILLD